MFNKKALLWVLPLIFFLIPIVTVLGQDTVNKDEVEELEEKIEKYEAKINDLQGRAKTLANEIEYMNSQISLTELKIQNSIAKISKTEKEIQKLAGDIEDLKARILKLEKSIDYQKDVLSARIRERYKSRDENTMVVLFGSVTLETMVQKVEYLKAMERYDNKLLVEMGDTKTRYDMQKNLFEQKKDEEEKLKTQLLNEKANLDTYKGNLVDQQEEKKRLLEVTQNDETKYQNLLAEAQRELNQIVGAAGALVNTESRSVKKGERIGIQGNTGYSFGAHLHFGVYRYSSLEEINGWNWYYSEYVDPLKKLESKTVYWNTGCESAGNRKVGKGDWEWPMSNPTVSQGFGVTCWSSSLYGGKPHPALDMYGPSNSSVYAVDDGDAYFCRNCLGDGGNGVFIFHDDDYMTVYWHLK